MSIARRSLFAWPLLAAGLITSCGGAPRVTAEKPAEAEPASATPHDRYANDLGRFLAGMPGIAGSPFQEREADPAWKQHAASFDKSWQNIETARLKPMREFQKSELSAPSIENSVMFYPFSGPDVLSASVFFPRNRTYVMVAWEPAGTLPSVQQLAKKPLESYLAGIRETLGDILSRSFFVTRQMDKQLRGQVEDGVFPTLLILLARTDHTVLGFRDVRIDEDGRLIDRPAGYTSPKEPGKYGNMGVEIEFQTNADKSVHKLYYFRADLADGKLKRNKPLLTYLAGLKGLATMFKSTSYMVHRPEFSAIRSEVLDKSVAVLQDDSGIPYKFFDAARWQVQLYGEYDKPYRPFQYMQQLDLKAAFAGPGIKPLGFRIGYGYAKIPSNLLLAKRK